MNLMAMRNRRAVVNSEGEAILALWASEERSGTEDEMTTIRALNAERIELDAAIVAAEERADLERAFPPATPGVTITGGSPVVLEDPERGFRSSGDFFRAVWQANPRNPNYTIDDRLKIGAAPTSPANTGRGDEGGYLIPPGISTRIYSHSLEEDALLNRTDNIPVEGNSMSFPKDETTPWGSTGVRAYWEKEAAQATQTRPVTETTNMRLEKLFALVPMTDELLDDAVALGPYIDRKAGESIRYKTNDALVNGSGAGQPLGFANSAAIVSQAKGGAAADTIKAENVAAMFSRNLNPSRAIWMINPDAWGQLPQMVIGDQPVFTPPNGFIDAPQGLLFGRPVIMSETCQTLGDLGDIYFVDWSAYLTITKAGGIQTATSMHLWFDYDVTAFRATFRIDGQPWLASAVTPPNSAITRSPFVSLAERA